MYTPSTLPTLSGASGGGAGPVQCVVKGVLAVDSGRHYRFPEGNFTMGRGHNDGISLEDPARILSRTHAFVERQPDHIVVHDRTSRNGVKVAGQPVPKATIRPGEVFELGHLRFLALSNAMIEQHTVLDRLVGAPQVIHDLLTLPANQHAALLGVRKAPLALIAESQHRAISVAGSHIAIGVDPNDQKGDLAEDLAHARNGRVYVEGREGGGDRAHAYPTKRPPRFPRDFLVGLAGATQRTAVTVGLYEPDDLDNNLLRRGCKLCFIPSVAERLQGAPEDRDQLIDAVLGCLGLPWRARHLHPDVLHALVGHYWPGDHNELEVVLAFAGNAWSGCSQRSAKTEAQSRTTLLRWLREIGLTWERLRELAPARVAAAS